MCDRLTASPLMDGPRFARNVEAAYRDVWRRWCGGIQSVIRAHNAPMATDRALERAMQLYQIGQFGQAETICHQLLATQPNHADALQLLGLLAHRMGQSETAVELMRKAIAANPRVNDYHNNLAVMLTTQGRLEEAVETYRTALALSPTTPSA